MTKKCSCCKLDLPIILFYNNKRAKDGKQEICKTCARERVKQTQLKSNLEPHHWDGFYSEKDHFNAALDQYAKVFNMPSLLKYKKK
jgi:superfamily II helicase